MQITSPTFTNLNTIPNKYGFEGKNISPTLMISEVPDKALSLAIIMHDPMLYEVTSCTGCSGIYQREPA
jgi:phosphatidylethanolamine-binding protein (PEBP) family uncharacterized protein